MSQQLSALLRKVAPIGFLVLLLLSRQRPFLAPCIPHLPKATWGPASEAGGSEMLPPRPPAQPPPDSLTGERCVCVAPHVRGDLETLS